MRESPELDDLAYERQRQRRTEAQSQSGLGRLLAETQRRVESLELTLTTYQREVAHHERELHVANRRAAQANRRADDLEKRVTNLRQKLTSLAPIVTQAVALARTVENFSESTAPRQASNKHEEREVRLFGR